MGRYLRRSPADVAFQYGTHGKPALAKESGRADVRFNVSHSGDMAVYGIILGREVGVDIEYVRYDFPCREISGRFFSPREVNMLEEVPAPLQREAFFQCWTRKEAYIKARGLGLSLPLNSFDVSLKPSEPPALLESREEGQAASDWDMSSWKPGPGYLAAVIVEGQDCAVEVFSHNDLTHQLIQPAVADTPL